MFKGKTVREAVRISRAKDIPATAKIERQLNRLSRMSKMTKYGGIALTAAGAAMACHQIGKTEERHKKNEIFVETLSSTVAGTAGSIVLSAVLFSNPVGWGVALVAGTALAVGSYATGKGMAKVYDKHFNQYDLVDSLQVDKLCR